ncbi:MAG: phage tail protein [Candidatus Scalindua sp.]|nr:phage tail protein [Candidatus Scalindua sp.]
MFNSLELFFDNGGGPCYIVSVGGYSSAPTYAQLKAGVDALKKYDEPTLFVIPDSVSLSAVEHGTLMADVLSQCKELQDRFAIMDVYEGDETSVSASSTYTIANNFRGRVSSGYLKYGAAYFPFVKAFLTLNYNYESIAFIDNATDTAITDLHNLDTSVDTGTEFGLVIDTLDSAEGIRDAVNTATGIDTFKVGYDSDMTTGADFAARLTNAGNTIKTKAEDLIGILDPGAASPIADATPLHDNITDLIDSNSDLKSVIESLVAYDVQYGTSGLSVFSVVTASTDPGDPKPVGFSIPGVDYIWETGFNGTDYTDAPDYELYNLGDFSGLDNIYTGATTDEERYNQARPYFDSLYNRILIIMNSIEEEVQDSLNEEEGNLRSTSMYQGVLSKIRETPIEIPPSGAVAGIYARVDNDRGVWKAPANVVVSSILGPSVKVDDKDQEGLNVDATSGKSINAIRAFTGKGTLIWGARTLAGNDNEWRYVSVRRFYNMVEESVKKATAWAVFEANDANLWVKVKGMIDNFLTTLWRQGALAGSSTDQAFYVNVGLDETMTSLDILEGRMIVEIGMAAVRPAEFIVLKFSHKMQEA